MSDGDRACKCGVAIVRRFPKTGPQRLFGFEAFPEGVSNELGEKADKENRRILDHTKAGRIICSGDVHRVEKAIDT